MHKFCGCSIVSGASRTNEIVLTLLLELKAEMRDVREQLTSMQDILNNVPGFANTEVDNTHFKLPIQSQNDLDVLEGQLQQDKAMRQKLVSLFKYTSI
jgi:hypothetical protein